MLGMLVRHGWPLQRVGVGAMNVEKKKAVQGSTA
jgi:hypothetical protein